MYSVILDCMSNDSKAESATPFCALPFLQLALYPGGYATPCCIRSADNYFPGVTGDNLSDFLNHPGFQKLREEFISGNVKTCARDIRDRGCNRTYEHLEHLVERKKVIKNP